MGLKTKIGIVTGVFVLGLCAIAYAYDRSQETTIADGVTIGGVGVGGRQGPQTGKRGGRPPEAGGDRGGRRAYALPVAQAARLWLHSQRMAYGQAGSPPYAGDPSMATSPEARLKELGITLPGPGRPMAKYKMAVRVGNMLRVDLGALHG